MTDDTWVDPNQLADHHIKQAEVWLKVACDELDTAQSQREWRRVKTMIQISQAHAQIARAARER